MSERRFISVRGKLTLEQRRRFEEGKAWFEENRERLNREALGHKAALRVLIDAMKVLKREREARGLSLAEVAERSGIDKSNLSKLENDPYPNPTLATLTRIAEAIGVRIKIGIVYDAA